MNPAVERLTRILGLPPQRPSGPPWMRAPEEIGFQFPSDYREFIDLYGSVRINEELSVWTPKRRSYGIDDPGGFRGFVHSTTNGIGDYLAGAHEDDPRECPYPVFPDAGGLLAWASNPNVDHCFWLTEGDDPEKWPVVIWYRQLAEWDRYDGGMAEFILAVVTGTYPMADEIAPSSPGIPLWRSQSDWES